MKDYLEKLQKLEEEVAGLRKALTFQKGVGVEDGDDGNMGTAKIETGEVEYEKQKQMARKKMLVSKMMADEE